MHSANCRVVPLSSLALEEWITLDSVTLFFERAFSTLGACECVILLPENDGTLSIKAGFSLYEEMRYHPGHIDTQQHDAEWVAHATSEHTSEHAKCEHDGERHIQQEEGAVIDDPLPEEQRQGHSKG